MSHSQETNASVSETPSHNEPIALARANAAETVSEQSDTSHSGAQQVAENMQGVSRTDAVCSVRSQVTLEERRALGRILNGMKQRCHNPNSNIFARYGGRGITVCPRWRASTDAFVSDMGPRPSPKHSIERIDNDAGYSPENCKWATAAEQRHNQAYTQYVLHAGKAVKMSDYRQIAGIGTKAIFAGFKDGSVPECCRRGHLYTPENTQMYGKSRWCKTCRRASEKRSWEKRKPFETEYKRAFKARRAQGVSP